MAADLSAYYGAGFLKEKPSKEAIYKIMTLNNKPTSISYEQARVQLFNKLHLLKSNKGYFIRDVYCERDMYAPDLGGQVGPNQIPNHTLMNIEHTWPQSRFSNQFSKDTQKTDLHHLFPSNSHTNSQRGNLMFAEVNSNVTPHNCDPSKLGSAQLDNDGKVYFEPAPDHRGNVARALFYFSVRYKSIITPTEEFYLRKWHEEDPVDKAEIERHEKIYSIQNVRNPFIDYPQLVGELDNF